jgi:transcriptional regulator with XRE-family HTH domain
MKRLGGRIKIKREALKLPLSEVSRKAGISASALSQIENAKAFPSIVTLKAIADVLNTTVGELIGENETISFVPLIRESERVFVTRNKSGAELFMLSNRETGKQMGTYIVLLQKGSDTTGFLKEHAGQEFCHLIEGELDFTIDGTIYTMKRGDSLYYNSSKARRAENKSVELAKLLWIVTPPEF